MEKHRSKEIIAMKPRHEIPLDTVGGRLNQRKKRSKEDLIMHQINEEEAFKPSPRFKAPTTKRKPLKPQQLYDAGYDSHTTTAQHARNFRPNVRRGDLQEGSQHETLSHQSTRTLPHIYA